METIQVVLGKKLLQAIDRAARQTKQNRSALVREALREYLQKWKCAHWKDAIMRGIPGILQRTRNQGYGSGR